MNFKASFKLFDFLGLNRHDSHSSATLNSSNTMNFNILNLNFKPTFKLFDIFGLNLKVTLPTTT